MPQLNQSILIKISLDGFAMNLENILNMLGRQENKEGITNNFMHLFLLFHVTFRNLKSPMCPAYICGPVLAYNILHIIKKSISVSKFL